MNVIREKKKVEEKKALKLRKSKMLICRVICRLKKFDSRDLIEE